MKVSGILIKLSVVMALFISVFPATQVDLDDIARVRALVANVQTALEEAQRRQGAGVVGAGESVAFLAVAAATNLPEMLQTLPLLGVDVDDLGRYTLRGNNDGVMVWFDQLIRQRVLVRKEFDRAKVSNGIIRAGDFVNGLNINSLVFMTQTYNMVRNIFEANPADPIIRDLVFQYFNKLEEQDNQCCQGAVGRTFHAFAMFYMHLFNDLRGIAAGAGGGVTGLLAPPPPRPADGAALATPPVDREDVHNRADYLLAQQMQIEEDRQALLRRRLELCCRAEQEERSTIDRECLEFSPRMSIHPGRGQVGQLFFTLEPRTFADVRTANRLYIEAFHRQQLELLRQQSEAERIARAQAEIEARLAAEQRALQEQAQARVDAMMRRIYDAKDAILTTEFAYYKTQLAPVNGECPGEMHLSALDSFGREYPALAPQIALLRDVYTTLRSSADPMWWDIDPALEIMNVRKQHIRIMCCARSLLGGD